MRNDLVATGYVFTPDKDKMLMIHHRKLGRWLPPGGHMEPNELPHEAALREVWEETGVHAEIVDTSRQVALDVDEWQLPTPHFVLHERIPATEKDVEHMHVDFCYIMQADQSTLAASPEVRDARWFALDEVEDIFTYDSVKSIASQIMKR